MSEGIFLINVKRLLRMVLSIVLAVPAGAASAQSYLVHHYTIDDGLPSSTVFDIEQDNDGVIWFATDAGVVSFDGLQWDLVGSFPTIRMRAANLLEVDENKNVWVGSNGNDIVAHFDGKAWARVDLPETNQRIRILSLAILTEDGFPLLALGTEFTGLFIRRGETWKHYDQETGLPGNCVQHVGAHGDSFVIATDQGIAIWNQDELHTSLNAQIPANERELLALDVTGETPHDEVWLLSRNSVAVIEDGAYRILHSGLMFMSELNHFVLLKDRGDFLFFGSSQLLYQLNVQTGEIRQLNKNHGLVNNDAFDLLLDRENNIWIGGYRGADKIASTFMSSYKKYHGLLSNEVTAVTESLPDEFVFGHPSGLSILKDCQFTTIPFLAFEDEPWTSVRVLDLYTAGDGTVWISAHSAGVGSLDDDHYIRWFGPEEGINGAVCSVIEDSGGTLFALEQDRLLRFETDRFVAYDWYPENEGSARRMFPGSDGKIYIACNSGFYIFKDGVVTRVPGLDTARSADVFAVFEDKHNRVWVGTMAGLFVLEDDILVRPSEPLPQITSPIFFIIEDHEGEIWIGGGNGVLRWSGESLTHYSTANGLAGRETNRDAGFVDHRGRIWIGTEGGVSVATKREQEPPVPRPQIDQTLILSGDKEFSFDEPLQLKHSTSSVTFQFRMVSFLDEKRVKYSHRLEGLETEWSEPAPSYERKVQYSHLGPGRYRFHVKACNSAGTWSECTSSGQIRVLPPHHKRWWFLLITFGGGGLITTLLVISILRARYTSRLEREVTARTAELKESEELYRKLFEGDFPRLLIDPKTMEITDTNLAGSSLAGLSKEKLVGFKAGHTGVLWIDRLPAAIHDDARGSTENYLITDHDDAAGQPDLEIRSQRVSIRGEEQILVTAQDVTARRRLEDEQLRASKLESVGLLAGGIAHDFNNLLTAILGNLSLGRMELDDGNDPGASLEAAEEASERARKLTAQLLVFSRGGEPIRTILDIEPLLRASIEFALTGSKVRCVFRIQSEMWPIEGDEGQLDQVLSNLALNALQAMPKGGTLTVATQNLRIDEDPEVPLEAGNWVTIAISDEGIGLPPESIQQVFDPYFTTKGTGNGLGLATCYSIIKKHQGLIQAANMSGGGAQFTIYLPATPNASPEKGFVAPLPKPDSTAKPSRILIMDDEPALQVFYDRALQTLGHESQITGDGKAAEEAFRRALETGNPFDVVILDLTVPGGMGGKEALTCLRRLNPEVPAIVASGYSNDPDMADFTQAGFQGALKKPFTVTDLGAILDRVLKLSD